MSDQCADPGCYCTRDPEELKLQVHEITVDPDARCSVRAGTKVPCGGIATHGDLCEYHARTLCDDCGYPEDSFACKIRHVSVNVENLRRDH